MQQRRSSLGRDDGWHIASKGVAVHRGPNGGQEHRGSDGRPEAEAYMHHRFARLQVAAWELACRAAGERDLDQFGLKEAKEALDTLLAPAWHRDRES